MLQERFAAVTDFLTLKLVLIFIDTWMMQPFTIETYRQYKYTFNWNAIIGNHGNDDNHGNLDGNYIGNYGNW